MRGIKFDFTNNTRVSNFKLVLIVLGMPIALLPVWLLTRFAKDLYYWIPNHTAWLITPTLILYLIMYFVFIYLMLIRGSKLSLKELGFEKSRLRDGVIVSIALLITLQLYGVFYSYFTSGKLIFNETLTEWTPVVGNYVQFIFGVAFFEEVAFRSFLIPQIFLRLKSGEKSRVFMALIISQALFSIAHVPVRLINGFSLTDLMVSLAAVFGIGMIFSFIYILTGNLFIAIGIHALWDISMIDAVSLYSDKYPFIVILIFSFILMYVSAARNKENTIAKAN